MINTSFQHEYRVAGVQVMDYNVPGGKLNRGMAVYDVVSAIKGADVSLAASGSRGFVCGSSH